MSCSHGSGAAGSSNGAPPVGAALQMTSGSPPNSNVQPATKRLTSPMWVASSDPPSRQSLGSAAAQADDLGTTPTEQRPADWTPTRIGKAWQELADVGIAERLQSIPRGQSEVCIGSLLLPPQPSEAMARLMATGGSPLSLRRGMGVPPPDVSAPLLKAARLLVSWGRSRGCCKQPLRSQGP